MFSFIFKLFYRSRIYLSSNIQLIYIRKLIIHKKLHGYQTLVHSWNDRMEPFPLREPHQSWHSNLWLVCQNSWIHLSNVWKIITTHKKITVKFFFHSFFVVRKKRNETKDILSQETLYLLLHQLVQNIGNKIPAISQLFQTWKLVTDRDNIILWVIRMLCNGTAVFITGNVVCFVYRTFNVRNLLHQHCFIMVSKIIYRNLLVIWNFDSKFHQ